MNSNSKLAVEEKQRWEICYHEAAHAVVTAYYDAEHNGGDYDGVAEEIAIYGEPKDANDRGHKCSGYYQAHFHVNINLSIQDELDVYLAGFYGEQLNPLNERLGLGASDDDDPTGDVQSAERLCKELGDDPMVVLIKAKARLEKLMNDVEVFEAIHDVAKVCFVLSKTNEIIDGDIIDKVIINAIYEAKANWYDATYQRVEYLKSVVGTKHYRKLFPDLEEKMMLKEIEVFERGESRRAQKKMAAGC